MLLRLRSPRISHCSSALAIRQSSVLDTENISLVASTASKTGLSSVSEELPAISAARKAPKHSDKVVVITGPTAVGKTKVSLEVARRLGGEIISADSVQVYQGLDIGSDKVSTSRDLDRYLAAAHAECFSARLTLRQSAAPSSALA